MNLFTQECNEYAQKCSCEFIQKYVDTIVEMVHDSSIASRNTAEQQEGNAAGAPGSAKELRSMATQERLM